jgi:2,3-diketo-5-methylthio-1-phosphopentane phosphatase
MTESPPKLYLLDVEGTIAPLSLVSEQLFPYARAHFADFLEKNALSDADVQKDLFLLIQENYLDRTPGVPNMTPDSDEVGPGLPGNGWSFTMSECRLREVALEYVYWLMDRDRKSTALKSLQGKIWKSGFESGELKGTLFEDVPAALERWSKEARVAIYSSGSTEAQRLLFRYSVYGDLTPLIAGYFDTRTGAKSASSSYAAVAEAMRTDAGDLLFFSDAVRELDAARDAGCQTRLVVREGNAPVDDSHGHCSLESFAAL